MPGQWALKGILFVFSKAWRSHQRHKVVACQSGDEVYLHRSHTEVVASQRVLPRPGLALSLRLRPSACISPSGKHVQSSVNSGLSKLVLNSHRM